MGKVALLIEWNDWFIYSCYRYFLRSDQLCTGLGLHISRSVVVVFISAAITDFRMREIRLFLTGIIPAIIAENGQEAVVRMGYTQIKLEGLRWTVFGYWVIAASVK